MKVFPISKGEKTKQHIIEQSAFLLNKQGYMSTSLSEIMSVTGMKKGSLYNHFKDKEELVSLAFGHCLYVFNQLLEEALAKQTTSKGRLLAFIETYCNFDEETLPGGCPIMNVTVEIYDGLSDRLQEQAGDGMKYVIGLLVDIIETGKAEGEFRKDADANRAATILISTIEGGLLLSKLRKNTLPASYVLNHLTSFVENELSM